MGEVLVGGAFRGGLVGRGLWEAIGLEGKDRVNGGRSGFFFYIISIIIASLAGVC